MVVNVPDQTTINTSEFKPGPDAIAFAPELISFILHNQKLTTYRFGKKYDHFKAGDVVRLQDSATGKTVGKLRITRKITTVFAALPLDAAGHETYQSKEHQRRVLSGYYAYLGRSIRDDDLFLVFDFELVS